MDAVTVLDIDGVVDIDIDELELEEAVRVTVLEGVIDKDILFVILIDIDDDLLLEVDIEFVGDSDIVKLDDCDGVELRLREIEVLGVSVEDGVLLFDDEPDWLIDDEPDLLTDGETDWLIDDVADWLIDGETDAEALEVDEVDWELLELCVTLTVLVFVWLGWRDKVGGIDWDGVGVGSGSFGVPTYM